MIKKEKVLQKAEIIGVVSMVLVISYGVGAIGARVIMRYILKD